MAHRLSDIQSIEKDDNFSPLRMIYNPMDMTLHVQVAGYNIATIQEHVLLEMSSYNQHDFTVLINDRLHELCKSQRAEIEQLRDMIKRAEDVNIFKDVPFK